MQKIVPCLWYDDQAEEAAKFYTSLFKDSKVGSIMRYDAASAAVAGKPEGSVLTVDFQIEGQGFIAMNGGPAFKFTEAVSFIVNCKDQAEIDFLWQKLTEGGQEVQCGWLKDKYGLSWQIVPIVLNEMLADKDPARAQRVMKAMLQMKKIIIAELKKAYQG